MVGGHRCDPIARGYATSFQYDPIGRRERRFVEAPADAAPSLEASWQYDQLGKRGVLSTVLGSDGFRRDYRYDAFNRPFRVTTQVPVPSVTAPTSFVLA